MSRKRFLAIVDPWEECIPEDVEKFPPLESDTAIQCQLIHNQLSRLKPLFDDIIVVDSRRGTNSLFDELPNVSSAVDSFLIDEYISDKQDWDMWLCGFHYGRCIHSKIDEVMEKYDWDNSRFHIIQNLSFMFPKDTKSQLQTWDRFCSMIDIKEHYWDYVDSLSEL